MRKLRENLFVYEDTCRVYVIKHHDRAVLIDFGSGAILQELALIGVQRIDMVLHTNHHRDVCGGDHLLDSETVIYVPENERYLFEDTEHFWDRLRVYVTTRVDSIEFTRTTSVTVRGLEDGESILWEEYVFQAISTPGDSRGAISIVWDNGGEKIVFCGDLISAPGKVHAIFDFQWEYLPAKLFYKWIESLEKLSKLTIDLLCPSHGEAMDDGKEGIELLRSRALTLERMMIPELIPYPAGNLYRVLPHLIYVDKTTYLIMSESGHGILIDYGYVDYEQIVQLKDNFGLKKIDAIIFTHYHIDHIARAAEAQFHPWTSKELFREVEIWNLNQVADIVKNPKRYKLPGLHPSNTDSDRIVSSGDHIRWNEYDLYFYHHPGQTYYALGLFVEIDGRKVLFTGDNIWPTKDGKLVTPVIFKDSPDPEGFIRVAHEMKSLNPSIIATGHYGAIPVNETMLDSYIQWSLALKEKLYEIVSQDPPLYGIDCRWAYFYPYIAEAAPGEEVKVWLRVKNHSPVASRFNVNLCLPEGISCESHFREIAAGPHSKTDLSFTLVLADTMKTDRRYVVTVEIDRNGKKCGEVAEFMIEVKNRREFL
ncbi:MBL fold metallo-hydrolase [Paenibacillus montanisoli]|uniref:Metallo-beta-lactamase domain-containing protein n=1 Tax=Paenibacillus montanisoli TaxID=2081970 RepID=A0A328U4E6_9BACL|nr:MBL fold metallo-hydrolase [Paenibacillus montanisoli]RAP77500.1 hypothetical protein DL346_03195 [Paenibacillus montanisoli]